MYFSQTNTRNQFELYLSFLGEVISKNNPYYKDLFVGIIKDVVRLSNKSIDYSEISNTHFNIISSLASKHSDYFHNIDLGNFPNDVFEKTLSFLKDDLEEPAYY